MANVAKNAILRAKLNNVLTDIMVKTTASQVYVDDTTTLAAHLATLAAKADVTALQETINKLGALASKDKISQADLDEALATLITGKADQTALQAELDRATAAEEALGGRIDTLEDGFTAAENAFGQFNTKLNTMWNVTVGEGNVITDPGDSGKSIRTIANEELAAQLIGENAKESLDTLAEIAAWIQSHPDDASAMNQAIAALQTKVDTGDQTVSAYVTAAIEALKIGDYAKAADLTALAGRVEALETTVAGLGDLATEDIVSEDNLSDELKEKINASSEGNHSHNNKAVLDEITAEKVAAWDAAEQNAKDHADGLNEAMDGRMQAVEGKAHEHANKAVLDGITTDVVASWNGKANIYYSAEEPANLTENDLWFQIIE